MLGSNRKNGSSSTGKKKHIRIYDFHPKATLVCDAGLWLSGPDWQPVGKIIAGFQEQGSLIYKATVYPSFHSASITVYHFFILLFFIFFDVLPRIIPYIVNFRLPCDLRGETPVWDRGACLKMGWRLCTEQSNTHPHV